MIFKIVNFKKLALIISVNALLTVALLEAICRILDKGVSYTQYRTQAANGYYIEDPNNTFTLKANYSGTQINQDRNLHGEPNEIRLSTDEFGHRLTTSDRVKRCKDPERVLFIGDSYTFGVYLRDKDTIPSQLLLLSQERGKCLDVINAGYADGHEADQIYSWLYQNISKIDPDYIVYNAFPGNDILGISQISWRDQTKLGLPKKWINNKIYVQNGIIRDVGGKPPLLIYYMPVLRELKILALVEQRLKPYLSKLGLKFYNVGFNPDSFAHIYGNYTPEFIAKEKLFIRLVLGMRDLASQNNAEFLIAYVPANFEIYHSLTSYTFPQGHSTHANRSAQTYSDRFCSLFDGYRITCINLAASMKASMQKQNIDTNQLPPHNYLYPSHGEIHLSRSGSKFVAEEIYSRLP